jgi:hypothetical protein
MHWGCMLINSGPAIIRPRPIQLIQNDLNHPEFAVHSTLLQNRKFCIAVDGWAVRREMWLSSEVTCEPTSTKVVYSVCNETIVIVINTVQSVRRPVPCTVTAII